ncbi:hypothetical protein BHM03_00058530, partial [Ensete ventricosum]
SSLGINNGLIYSCNCHSTWQVRWATSDATFGVADGAEVVEERSSGVPRGRRSRGAAGEEDAASRMVGVAG